MELGVYFREDNAWPLVLVALCTRPPAAAERLYGPLQFRGVVDTRNPMTGVEWKPIKAEILAAMYASVDAGAVGDLVLSTMYVSTLDTALQLHGGNDSS